MKSLICLLCLFVSGSVQADIYKYTDAEGMMHYTNIKPDDVRDYKTFTFPCYASDPKCHNVDWEQVPLNTQLFQDEIRIAASQLIIALFMDFMMTSELKKSHLNGGCLTPLLVLA